MKKTLLLLTALFASLTIANHAQARLGDTVQQIEATFGASVEGPVEDGADRNWYRYTNGAYSIWVWFTMIHTPNAPNREAGNRVAASRVSYQRADGAALSFAEVTATIQQNTPGTVVWDRMQIQNDGRQTSTGNDFNGDVYYVVWDATQHTVTIFTGRDDAIHRTPMPDAQPDSQEQPEQPEPDQSE